MKKLIPTLICLIFATLCFQFANAQLTITASPSDTMCAGNNVFLTASGATTYTWAPIKAISGPDTGAIIVAIPTVTTTYTVTGTIGSIKAKKTLTITVLPAPTITISKSSSYVCSGVPDTLIASGSPATYTWTWLPCPMCAYVTRHGDTLIANQATSYQLNAISPEGCSATKTATVALSPPPTIKITGKDTICQGDSATLRVSGANTYTWSTGATTTSIRVSPTSTIQYNVLGINTKGCNAYGYFNLTINPTPTVGIISSATSICKGDSAKLSVAPSTSITISGPISYLWSTGSYQSHITIAPTYTHTYSLIATNSSGCSGSAYETITVNPSPTIKTNDKDSVCSGDSVTIKASGATSYIWNTGATTSTITVSPISNSVYTVVGTNSYGCSGTAGDTIQVNPTPTINIAVSATTICGGGSTILTASGATSYTWKPSSSLSSSTGSSVIALPVNNITYTVTGSSIGCKSESTQSITVNNCPGTKCSNSISLNDADCLDNEQLTGIYKWYSVTAKSKHLLIIIDNIKADSNSGHIHKAYLYSSCSVAPIDSGSLSSDSAISFTLMDTNVIKGHTYYLKLTRDVASCQGCNPTEAATYSVCRYLNGVDALSSSFIRLNSCGLNFTEADQQVEVRSKTPPICNLNGTGLPTSVNLKGLPLSCYTIAKAYIYWTTSYYTKPSKGTTVTITNPTPATTSFPATVIGWDIGKLWGELGTAAYRADVTSCITGNGTYTINISGSGCSSKEVDGVSLVVIYNDLTATYQGNIELDDGIITSAGNNNIQYTMTSSFDPSGKPCLPGTNATTFTVISDMQDNANGNQNTENYNSSTATFPNNFWNYCSIPTTLSAGQTSLNYKTYTNNSTLKGDAYAICLAGLYWQSNCAPTCAMTNACAVNCTATANSTSYTGGLIIPNASFSSTYGTSPLTITGCPSSTLNISVNILGTFTITGICNLNNCNISMSPNSQIIVTNGATLNIDNARLFGCCSMWKGILVQPGGTLNVTNGSIIEDALIGIEGQTNAPTYTIGGNITIDDSKLNNNNIDVQIDKYQNSVVYPFSMRTTTLTTSPDPGFSGSYLKAPFPAKTITSNGIYLNTVGMGYGNVGINIGDPGSNLYLNQFSNMNYGIDAINSDFEVLNNSFSDMAGWNIVTLAAPKGIAIRAISTSNNGQFDLPTYCQAIIGGSNINEGNSITDCYRGIDITGYFGVEVRGNAINASSNLPVKLFRLYGDHGVYYKPKNWCVFGIDNNTINDYNTAIHVAGNSPAAQPTDYNTSVISSNVIGLAHSTDILTTGILAENLTHDPTVMQHTLYVQNNTITSAHNCIHINTIMHGMNMQVTNNPVLHILPSTNKNDATFKAGIFITGCQGVLIYVEDNPDISAIGTYIGAPKPPLTPANADINVTGIYDQLSQAEIACNNIHDVGQGMKFEGACNFVSVFNNVLSNNMYDGFVLTNSGVIGSQASSSGADAAFTWPATPFNSQTATYNSTSQTSHLYVSVKPTNNYTNVTPFVTDYFNTKTLLTPKGAPPACLPATIIDPGYGPIHAPSKDSLNISEMHLIVEDSVNYPVFTNEMQYMSEQDVFTQLSMDSTLMQGDTLLQYFYNKTLHNCMGGIYSIEKQISLNNYTVAQSINNSLTPSCHIEQNHQTVNSIFLAIKTSGIDTIDSIQQSTLQNIANECPMTGGKAVYQARSLLNVLLNTSIEYVDSCFTNIVHNSILKKKENDNYINASVYPNPANSILNIDIQLNQSQMVSICIYNSEGQNIFCQDLVNNITILPIENLPTGIYLYRITDSNGKLIKTDKIMLMR